MPNKGKIQKSFKYQMDKHFTYFSEDNVSQMHKEGTS